MYNVKVFFICETMQETLVSKTKQKALLLKMWTQHETQNILS